MSTVLTNGIIIPDNGNRNWGGDLANNWNIIDVNVGYMTDVKNRVTTLENSVAENSANIQINTSNISALQTSKQDTIEDLETIRSGASAGATAVQPSVLNNYLPLTGGAITGNIENRSTGDGWKPGFEWLYNDKRFAYIHAFTDAAKGEKSLFIQADTNVNIASRTLSFMVSNDDGSQNALNFQAKSDGTFNFYSNTPANLGTSTNKWKSLNGINPGALSLPSGANKIEISIPQGASTYTPPADGWLQVTTSTQNFLLDNGLEMKSRFFFSPIPNLKYNEFGACIPCRKGIVCNIYVDTATVGYFLPCQGNV